MLKQLCVTVLCLFGAQTATAGESIRLVTTDYPPYYGSDLPENGVVVAITKAAFKHAGYDVTVEFMPWARALSEVEAGRRDGLLGAWYSAERVKAMAFSEPLLDNEIGFFAKRSSGIATATLDKAKSYRIGTVRGYANPPEFEAAQLTVEEANNDLTNLKKLDSGRIDLILVDRALANHLINTQMPGSKGELAWVDPPVAKLALFNAFSRKVPGYETTLAEFNRGLEALKSSGELKAIVDRFGLY